MQLLNGKEISQKIKAEIKSQVEKLIEQQKRIPKLVVIIVGEDFASKIYVKNKIKACQECDIIGEVISFSKTVSEDEIINQIEKLNQSLIVDGILVQLPLATHLNELRILNSIAASKDVDGLTNINAGKLLQGDTSAIVPCTVKAIIALLAAYDLKISNQDITIINNSNIIGKPLAMLLNNLGATVTIAHKNTKYLLSYVKKSDIIISATGIYQLFSVEDVKEDVIIIDVAINNFQNKKLVGDINTKSMLKKVKAISPVPGGVGPMTIAMLLQNLMILYQQK